MLLTILLFATLGSVGAILVMLQLDKAQRARTLAKMQDYFDAD